MVADLACRKVYLYYVHQLDSAVVFKVAEEIANRRAGGTLSKLFPADVQQAACRCYQRIQTEKTHWETLRKV